MVDPEPLPTQLLTMRWYTCTPVAFGGGEDFFARDSGLLCRGFQAVGVESRAVMPLPGGDDDQPDLIRTEYRNLESADWWRSHGLDGVVLYAWGSPRYRKVAKAIRQAGIFLVLNQDNVGTISPLNGLGLWLGEQYVGSAAGRLPGGYARFLGRVVKGLGYGLWVTDPLRASHLRQGNVIACLSPTACERYRGLLRWYGGMSLVARLRLIPHPVGRCFRWDGEPKQPGRILAVGRWQDESQKRTALLMRVVTRLLALDPSVEVMVAGRATGELIAWHRAMPAAEHARVTLSGHMPAADLARLMARAQILYCPSAYESFHLASAEALCSGCSVVAADSPSLGSMRWFTEDGASGTLARSDGTDGHVDALLAEIKAWQSGARDPRAISKLWCDRLHADKLAARIVKMMYDSGMPDPD